MGPPVMRAVDVLARGAWQEREMQSLNEELKAFQRANDRMERELALRARQNAELQARHSASVRSQWRRRLIQRLCLQLRCCGSSCGRLLL